MDIELPLDVHKTAEVTRELWGGPGRYPRSRSDTDKTLFFLDGPPNPSGQTHLGTIWNKVLKDVVVRQARMSGLSVVDQPGYDTHLFSTEQRVAAREGISSLDALESVGVASFESACESFEYKHIDRLERDFKSFGVGLDWANAYMTDTAAYADSVWRLFERLWESGDVERREQVSYWCPDCRRPLHKYSEVCEDHLPYADGANHTTRSAYVCFQLLEEDAAVVTRVGALRHIVCNTFLSVDPTRLYLRVETDTHGDVYVAEDAAHEVLRGLPPSVFQDAERVEGDRFVGERYERLTVDGDVLGGGPTRGRIVADCRDSPTGFRHGTPALAESDRQCAVTNDLPITCPITARGTFADTAGPLADLPASYDNRRADDRVLNLIRGDVIRFGEPVSRSEQCWLCDTPVIPRISEPWYVTLADYEDTLFEALSSVDWYPDDVGTTMQSQELWHPDWSRDQRFDAEQDGVYDWLVEQRAHWGLPIPVWLPEDGDGDPIVVGSASELADRADQPISADNVRPRRSVLDDVTITEDGTTYTRTPAVFADRFTAAHAAFIVGDFPEDGDKDRLWPVDLILEAKDQPGLWFFMQTAVGVPAFGRVPFERAYMHGFLTDDDGEKMSKSVGNVVTPSEATDRHAVDALRLYFLTNTEPAEDLSFDPAAVDDIEAKLQDILDAYETATQLREASDFELSRSAAGHAVDEWADEQVQTAARRCADGVSDLSFSSSVRAALELAHRTVAGTYVPLLSTVADRRGVLPAETVDTLNAVLADTARLLAPYAPHCAEVVYQSLPGVDTSVHATSWPRGLSPARAWLAQTNLE